MYMHMHRVGVCTPKQELVAHYKWCVCGGGGGGGEEGEGRRGRGGADRMERE